MTCPQCGATMSPYSPWREGVGFVPGWQKCTNCGHEVIGEVEAERPDVTEVPIEESRGDDSGAVPETEAEAPEDTPTPERRRRSRRSE